MAQFWVYENWQANGHRCTIHTADCGHCNNGQGARGGTDPHYGQWHGTDTHHDAFELATRTGATVKDCGHCSPATA